MSDEKPDDSAVDAYLNMRAIAGDVGGLHQFLLAHPEFSTHEQVSVIIADQMVRWSESEAIPVANFLQKFPEIADDSEAVADLVYCEWITGGYSGLPDIPGELVTKFPDLVRWINQQIEVHSWLEKEASSLDPNPATAERHALEPGSSLSRSSDSEPAVLKVNQNENWTRPDRALRMGSVVALMACLAVVMFVTTHMPDGENRFTSRRSTVTSAGRTRFELLWKLDASRAGDDNSIQLLPGNSGPLQPGDAIWLKILPGRPAYVYAFTIDPGGHPALAGWQMSVSDGETLSYPTQSVQGVSVPKQDGTMLCVAVVRETPLENPESILPFLRIASPLPVPGVDQLIVDGASLTPETLLARNKSRRRGSMSPELQSRLGNMVASRSMSAVGPRTDVAFTESITAWIHELPEELGDIHYLSIRIRAVGR